jgi:hypothetical protein
MVDAQYRANTLASLVHIRIHDQARRTGGYELLEEKENLEEISPLLC